MAYDWFKVNSKGWLEGSIRVDLTAEQRGVWVDLLALASECRERNGRLEFAPGKPMGISYIAGRLQIPEDLLKSTISACHKDKNKNNDKNRIEIIDGGTIVLTNFEQYQAAPFTKQPYDSRSREAKAVITARQYIEAHPDEAIDKLETKGYKVTKEASNV